MEVTPDKFLWLFLVVATLGWILFKYVSVCPSSSFLFLLAMLSLYWSLGFIVPVFCLGVF
jgi:hypothetical protein